jgi:hypothetical protein
MSLLKPWMSRSFTWAEIDNSYTAELCETCLHTVFKASQNNQI